MKEPISIDTELDREFQKITLSKYLRKITGLIEIDRDTNRYGYCKKCNGLIRTQSDTFCYICNSLMEFIFIDEPVMYGIVEKLGIEIYSID